MPELSSRLDLAETTARRLNKTLDDVCSTLKDLDDPEARGCGRQLSREKANLYIDGLPDELRDVAQDATKLQHDFNAQKTQLISAKDRLAQVREENKTLQAENRRLKKRQDDDDDLPGQLRETKREIARLKREKQELADQLDDADLDGRKVNRLEAKIDILSSDVSSLRDEKDVLTKAKAKLEEEKQALEKERDDLKEKVGNDWPTKGKFFASPLLRP
jgi:regulator of replication initiation timing